MVERLQVCSKAYKMNYFTTTYLLCTCQKKKRKTHKKRKRLFQPKHYSKWSEMCLRITCSNSRNVISVTGYSHIRFLPRTNRQYSAQCVRKEGSPNRQLRSQNQVRTWTPQNVELNFTDWLASGWEKDF